MLGIRSFVLFVNGVGVGSGVEEPHADSRFTLHFIPIFISVLFFHIYQCIYRYSVPTGAQDLNCAPLSFC
jgi:hypothetical protein